MNQPTKVFVAMLVIAGLLVVAFFTLGPAAEKTYNSPQEVFDAAVKASRKGDMRVWLQCLTEGSRDRIAADGILDMFRIQHVLMKGGKKGEEIAVEFLKIAERHGLKADFLTKAQDKAGVLLDNEAGVEAKLAFSREVLTPVRDRNAFAADLFKEFQKVTGKPPPSEAWKDASLTDLKLTGDSAKGIMTFDRDGKTPMTFRRQGESWRIDLIALENRPQMPVMPR